LQKLKLSSLYKYMSCCMRFVIGLNFTCEAKWILN
jgi:hypothetical protein